MRTVGEASEAEVIALFADPATPAFPEVVVPNGDDAAAWRARPGWLEVATTDGLVEGVHFLRDAAPPRTIGHKLLAVNLSDLAAMGAQPRYALIAVCLPRALPLAFAEELGRGVRELAAECGVHVIGGNVTRSPGPIVLHATLIGEVEEGRALTRRGARVGDRVLVSGELGRARLVLAARGRAGDAREHGAVAQDPGSRGAPAHESGAYTAGAYDAAAPGAALVSPELALALDAPTPRLALGRALGASGVVRAMCDVSDGLARDVLRLVEPLGLGVRVDVDALPIGREARALAWALALDPLDEALLGGEDYELLCAVAEADVPVARAAASRAGVALSEIGVVTAAPGLVRSDGRPVGAGFEHFA